MLLDSKTMARHHTTRLRLDIETEHVIEETREYSLIPTRELEAVINDYGSIYIAYYMGYMG